MIEILSPLKNFILIFYFSNPIFQKNLCRNFIYIYSKNWLGGGDLLSVVIGLYNVKCCLEYKIYQLVIVAEPSMQFEYIDDWCIFSTKKCLDFIQPWKETKKHLVWNKQSLTVKLEVKTRPQM